VQSKFNLYDFVGYFVPGGIAIFVFWLATYEFWPAATVDWLKDLQLLLASILFVASYVAGHVIQTVRRRAWPRFATPQYSVALMLKGDESLPSGAKVRMDDSARLTADVRNGVLRALKRKFKADFDDPALYQTGWNLARECLLLRNPIGHAELYNSMATLYAGLAVVTRLALPVALLNLVIHAATLPLHAHLAHIAVAMVVGSASTFALGPIIERQFADLSQRFALSVYLSFYVGEAMASAENRAG